MISKIDKNGLEFNQKSISTVICSLATSRNEQDDLASSFAVKVSELARMYPKLVIGQRGGHFGHIVYEPFMKL